MKAFIAILLTILVIGLAIVQLILIRWTDGWLWPILHAALVIVSFRKKVRALLHQSEDFSISNFIYFSYRFQFSPSG